MLCLLYCHWNIYTSELGFFTRGLGTGLENVLYEREMILNLQVILMYAAYVTQRVRLYSHRPESV
jgi:hypothetical protein